MNVAVVVGNPKPRSRTLSVAVSLARKLSGADPRLTVDLADFGPAVLDPHDERIGAAIEGISTSDLVVVASPTYKGSYTGLLKVFLDRIGAGQLAGVTGVPLMLGGDLRHALAPDLLLKPVLVEIGLTCPTQGLFVVDSNFDDPAVFDGWLALAGRQVAATVGNL